MSNPDFVYRPPAGPMGILYLDDSLIFALKPPELLSVPGRLEAHKESVQSRIESLYPDALLIHRLDLETSGIMLFARNKAAQRNLGLQFERRHVRKEYIARVEGILPKAGGRVVLRSKTDWERRPKQIIDPEGKEGITDYQVLSRGVDETRVLLKPYTGRTHQLRIHMAHLGHPILGDKFYGRAASADRLMLHAAMLRVRHPDDGREVIVRAPPGF